MVFDNSQSWCEMEFSNNQVTESSRKCNIDTNALKKIPKEKDTIPDQNQHPYFISTLGSDWKYKLYLPINFTRSNGLRTRKMILRNGQSQMSWEVDLKIRPKEKGDHVKFELIETGKNPVAIISKYEDASEQSPEFIPKKFALANGLSNGEMIFKNVENEGLWTVKLRNQADRYFCIQHGLREFCTAIGLEKGDSFRFELIDNGKKPVAIVSSMNIGQTARKYNSLSFF
ncbi:hypothetical protein L1987_09987 [Smallanthus sonchifolius]|uniref:Uncharacterized protein n=1 Tax=Smallanthus sonchifolius TaxID=185202 RepID=A0ACB9JQU6_9ASTR|nr:hypothetical protein L1987_09987 [Smallanthus sonchifolius]